MLTVLVTGASRGIGLATCQRLLSSSETTKVIGVSRTLPSFTPELESLLALFSDRFVYVQGDLTNKATQDEALAACHGHLDSVIFNAGLIDPIARLATVNLDHFKHLMDVNLFSIWELAQKAIPLLKQSPQGRLLFVSSGAATSAYPGWGPYCISKCSLNMLSSVLAIEEPSLISFCLRPGVVATEMQVQIRREENVKEMGVDTHTKFTGLHERGELLGPEVPGGILAGLAVKAGKELSGQFLSWNDELLKEFRE
ncbi:hypothetical protein HDU98_005471 [Podochytrium sp. JEL0797]|nr:hypothetical protein HDU98_005471 [Podochytrium sp. JEL0797]